MRFKSLKSDRKYLKTVAINKSGPWDLAIYILKDKGDSAHCSTGRMDTHWRHQNFFWNVFHSFNSICESSSNGNAIFRKNRYEIIQFPLQKKKQATYMKSSWVYMLFEIMD